MVRRMLFTVAAVALVATPIASAGDESRQTDPRAGIEHARNAGVKVDPRSEEDMARAPIGSCANDPTLKGCPETRAYVHVDPDENGRYYLTQPATASKARTAAAPYCTLRASAPYYAAGYAQGDASNECYSTIARQELYSELRKLYNGSWCQMETTFVAKNGNGRIATSTRYRCTATVHRTWHHRATAYVNAGGTWWSSYLLYGNDFNCG